MKIFSLPLLALVLALVTTPACSQDVEADSPAAVVACNHSYALCAFANCTINDDLKTAACECYAFKDGDGGVNMAVVGLIPTATSAANLEIQQETRAVCNTTTSCTPPEGAPNDAPLCNAISNHQLWPSADLVSTFSPMLQAENGVQFNSEADGGAAIPTWMCPAAPGRLIPVCMLAPCVATGDTTNPYYEGTTSMTCTCPLVEATVAYNVLGGLQDPCSTSEPTMAGDFVTAAGGPLVAKLQSDPTVLNDSWTAVAAAFEGKTTPPETPNSNSSAAGTIHLAPLGLALFASLVFLK